MEEGVNFWDEGVNFLHGVFPYIRNPSFSTQESIQKSWLLVVFDPSTHDNIPTYESKQYLSLHFRIFLAFSSLFIFLLSSFSSGRMQKRRSWQIPVVIFVSHSLFDSSSAWYISYFSTLPFCCIQDMHCHCYLFIVFFRWQSPII